MSTVPGGHLPAPLRVPGSSRPKVTMLISSRSNPTIKRIRALRSRKEREESGLFFVEGIKLVGDAAESDAPIEMVIVAPDLLRSDFARETAENLRGRGVQVVEVTPDVFDTVSGKENPQGIAAVVRQSWVSLCDANLTTGLGWVALDGAQDPGNLGTVLRTSDAVGARGVILVGHTTDPYDPSAIRASMGAIFTQSLVRTTFDELATWRDAHRGFMLGTSDAAPCDYRQADYRFPAILLMGSEQHGLDRCRQNVCDLVVRIPMAGHSDSLNLAVATGVTLYELFYRYHGAALPVVDGEPRR